MRTSVLCLGTYQKKASFHQTLQENGILYATLEYVQVVCVFIVETILKQKVHFSVKVKSFNFIGIHVHTFLRLRSSGAEAKCKCCRRSLLCKIRK